MRFKVSSLFAMVAMMGSVAAQGFGETVRLTEVASTLTQPLAVRHAGDASGRLFILQQEGRIRWLDANGALQTNPFFDIRAASANLGNCDIAGVGGVSLGFSGSAGERGLLGLAFHPNFENNSFFFVNFTDTRGDTVVARFTATGNTTDYASCRVVLRVEQDYPNHNGGDLHFGPDGYLYIAMGDGGDGGDPCNRAQTLNPASLVNVGGVTMNGNCAAEADFAGIGAGNPDSRALLGKMLRLDVDAQTQASSAAGICGKRTGGSGSDLVAHYAIPASMGDANPYLGADVANACDEIWAYGLRNPWRFSFDRISGDMLIGDVGQGTTEEIDFEPFDVSGGRNYGWDVCEGPYLQGSRSNACTTPGAISPILEFSSENNANNPTNRCSITGGYRYHGGNTFFDGTYTYADYCSGEILFAKESSPGVWTSEVWSTRNIGTFNVAGFGEDESGNVYVTAIGSGRVYRFDIDLQFRDGFE